MPAASSSVDRQYHSRSRLTNGSTLLPGVDGRSTWARRLRDLMELHVADLGGPDNLSEAEKSIIRRASTLTVELERLELQFAKADEADATPWTCTPARRTTFVVCSRPWAFRGGSAA